MTLFETHWDARREGFRKWRPIVITLNDGIPHVGPLRKSKKAAIEFALAMDRQIHREWIASL